MKKHLFIFLMAFVASHGLKAQTDGGSRLFNLVLPDNTVVSYGLAEGVDIHFEDSIMVVNDLSFYMEDIVKYYFTAVESFFNIHPAGSGVIFVNTHILSLMVDTYLHSIVASRCKRTSLRHI